jgi:hypothetical protein
VLYYQISQYSDALDAYTRAIKLNPFISEVWYDLGTLYETCNNQTQDAMDAYTRALELDPSSQNIKNRLAMLTQSVANGQPPNPNDVALPQEIQPGRYPTQPPGQAAQPNGQGQERSAPLMLQGGPGAPRALPREAPPGVLSVRKNSYHQPHHPQQRSSSPMHKQPLSVSHQSNTLPTHPPDRAISPWTEAPRMNVNPESRNSEPRPYASMILPSPAINSYVPSQPHQTQYHQQRAERELPPRDQRRSPVNLPLQLFPPGQQRPSGSPLIPPPKSSYNYPQVGKPVPSSMPHSHIPNPGQGSAPLHLKPLHGNNTLSGGIGLSMQMNKPLPESVPPGGMFASHLNNNTSAHMGSYSIPPQQPLHGRSTSPAEASSPVHHLPLIKPLRALSPKPNMANSALAKLAASAWPSVDRNVDEERKRKSLSHIRKQSSDDAQISTTRSASPVRTVPVKNSEASSNGIGDKRLKLEQE